MRRQIRKKYNSSGRCDVRSGDDDEDARKSIRKDMPRCLNNKR